MTLLLLPPLVLFMEPLITLLNAISMLFVRNEISHAASALVDHNTLGTSLFFICISPNKKPDINIAFNLPAS